MISSVFADRAEGRKPEGELYCEQFTAGTPGTALMVRTSVKKLAAGTLW
jgi:hypothetical protein